MTSITDIQNRLSELPDSLLKDIYLETVGYDPFKDGSTRNEVVSILQEFAAIDKLAIPDSVIEYGF